MKNLVVFSAITLIIACFAYGFSLINMEPLMPAEQAGEYVRHLKDENLNYFWVEKKSKQGKKWHVTLSNAAVQIDCVAEDPRQYSQVAEDPPSHLATYIQFGSEKFILTASSQRYVGLNCTSGTLGQDVFQYIQILPTER